MQSHPNPDPFVGYQFTSFSFYVSVFFQASSLYKKALCCTAATPCGYLEAGKTCFASCSCYVYYKSLYLERNKVGIALLHSVSCFSYNLSYTS